MGMFDYVECRAPLPDGKPAVEFQTKNFSDPYIPSDGAQTMEDLDG